MLEETSLPRLPLSSTKSTPRTPIEEHASADKALGSKDPAEGFRSGQGFDAAAKELAARLDEFCTRGTNEYRPIAICGRWGSGKTSFAHKVVSQYSGRAQKVFFDPWMFSSQQSLFEQFFRELTVALGDDGTAMRNYGQAFLDVIGSGVFDFIEGGKYRGLGGGLASVIKSLGRLDRNRLPDVQGELQDLVAAKRAIEQQLVKIDYKLIVVVDNIDRLDPKLTTMLFQFLGSIVDLPNILYLLLFDYDVVKKALGSELKLEGDDRDIYLDKIVYLRLDLPDINLSSLVRRSLSFDREFPTGHLGMKERKKAEFERRALALELAALIDNPRTVHAVAHAFQSDRIFEGGRVVLPDAPICNAALRTKLHGRYLLLLQNDNGAIGDFLDTLEGWIDDLRTLFPYTVKGEDQSSKSHLQMLLGNESRRDKRRARNTSSVLPEGKDRRIVHNTTDSEQEVVNEELSGNLQAIIDNNGLSVQLAQQLLKQAAERDRLGMLTLFATILGQAGMNVVHEDGHAFQNVTERIAEHISYTLALNDYTGDALDIPDGTDEWIEAGGLQLWLCLLAACRERRLRDMTSLDAPREQGFVLGSRLFNEDADWQDEPGEPVWELGPLLTYDTDADQGGSDATGWLFDGPHLFVDGSSSHDDDE